MDKIKRKLLVDIVKERKRDVRKEKETTDTGKAYIF